MANPVSVLHVILNHPTNAEDAETIANAIRMIKGVANVETTEDDINTRMWQSQKGIEVFNDLMGVLGVKLLGRKLP